MAKVVHFDLYAKNPERAIRFYSEVLGWKFDKWEGPFDYWLITAGPDDEPGINGGLSTEAEKSSILTVGVRDIDSLTERIVSAGGMIIREKSAIPGVGWLIYFLDTEGNTLGMMEDDPLAQ